MMIVLEMPFLYRKYASHMRGRFLLEICLLYLRFAFCTRTKLLVLEMYFLYQECTSRIGGVHPASEICLISVSKIHLSEKSIVLEMLFGYPSLIWLGLALFTGSCFCVSS